MKAATNARVNPFKRKYLGDFAKRKLER